MEKCDKELENILSEYQFAGINVLHATCDEIKYIVSYGYQDIENNIKMNENTIFRIASVSKVIVALAAMTLVEKGLLDIKKDISTYLGFKVCNPKYPNDIITTEMLMTQTSSINDSNDDDYYGYDGVNGKHMYVPLKDLLTNPNYEYYTEKTYLDAKPGSVWCYSNFGCGILACIIEHITGKLFTDYVKEVILDPLNIDGGFRIEQVKNKELVASLYNYDSNKLVLCRNLELFQKYLFPKYPIGDNFRGPAGGMFVSALDLAKIMQMMMNKGLYKDIRILKEETIKEMERIHWQGECQDPGYKAKGLQLNLIECFTKDTLKGHCGSAYGLRSFMFYNKEHGYIFLCNGGDYKTFATRMYQMPETILKHLIKISEK